MIFSLSKTVHMRGPEGREGMESDTVLPRDGQPRQLPLQSAQLALALGQTPRKDGALHRTKAHLESLRALAIRCRCRSMEAITPRRQGTPARRALLSDTAELIWEAQRIQRCACFRENWRLP